MHESLTTCLTHDLGTLFPKAEIAFPMIQESGHDARMYVLLVARSGRLRWGRDLLFSNKRKGRTKAELSEVISRRVAKDLYTEVSKRNVVDEFLQDQLVVFQVLAAGRTSFSPPDADAADNGEERLASALQSLALGGGQLRRDKALEPFGEGSTHTATARWVTAEVMPAVKWFDRGRVCEGVGVVSGLTTK